VCKSSFLPLIIVQILDTVRFSAIFSGLRGNVHCSS